MIGEGIGFLADLFRFFFLCTLSLKTILFNFVETVEKDRITYQKKTVEKDRIAILFS